MGCVVVRVVLVSREGGPSGVCGMCVFSRRVSEKWSGGCSREVSVAELKIYLFRLYVTAWQFMCMSRAAFFNVEI